MPANTTAPWSIPYPLGTDRVTDGDDAMRAIAERVTDIFAANFVTSDAPYVSLIPLGTGWGGFAVYARRSGWIHLVIQATKTTWAASEVICTFPAGFRPRYLMSTPALGTSSGALLPTSLAPSGVLTALKAGVSGDGGIAVQYAYPYYA